ncbi:MAG: ATP-grasp domain-containing protein, partial [Planctomycetales bacterium]|nr:ATP-grasp domain-containing protein [Planctomycetales bacterium]
AGFAVAAADRFADADLAAACGGSERVARIQPSDAALVEWLRGSGADAWIYGGPLENRPELVDALAAVKPLWGVAGEALRRVRCPERLAAAVRRAGWRFPEFTRSPAGLPTDGSWLLKRDRSGGGSGVQTWRGDTASLPGEPHTWQRRIGSASCSALFVGDGQEAKLLAATEQLTGCPWCGAAEFHYCGTIAPLPLSPAQFGDLAFLGRKLAAQFQLRGLFGVDFVRDRDDWFVVEVNPRYTAAVEAWELATGRSALTAHAAAFGARIPATPARVNLAAAHSAHRDEAHAVVGKAIVFAREAVTIDAATAATWMAASDWRYLNAEAATRLADIPVAGAEIRAAGPVLSVLVRGATSQGVHTRLEQLVATVYNQLAECRRRSALPAT